MTKHNTGTMVASTRVGRRGTQIDFAKLHVLKLSSNLNGFHARSLYWTVYGARGRIRFQRGLITSIYIMRIIRVYNIHIY